MKDPAILFYWNDWHGGTITFSRHLKGCYMDLLYAQFNSGHLSLEEIRTVLGQDQANWTVLSKKFKQDENGLFYNERLDSEIKKRKAYSESRKNNKSGKNQYSKNDHMTKHTTSDMTGRMENENENRNEIIEKEVQEEKQKKFTTPTIEEIKAYCELRKNKVDPVKWFNFYQAKGWMIGKNKMKDWKAAVRTWEEPHETNQSNYKSNGDNWTTYDMATKNV